MTKATPQQKAAMLSYSQVHDWFVASKFIYWHEYAQVLYQSWLAGRNLVVYGKGGFGKSEMTYHFFNLLQQVDDSFTSDLLDCGGADSTKIWAGIKGECLPNFIYNVEGSWLASKYVVFEELFDAQLGALVEMKQTLTSGEFRTPLQRYTSKCQWLVCLTNKSKAEVLDSVSEDSRNTVDALLQRFPLAYNLEWTKQQLQDTCSWRDLLQQGQWVIHPQVIDLFAAAIAECHKTKKSSDDYMSPRSALHLLTTTQAWATSCNQQLDLGHFLDTLWAYPSTAQVYFTSQEYHWVTPQPPAPPATPLEIPDFNGFKILVDSIKVDTPLVDLLTIQDIAAAVFDKYSYLEAKKVAPEDEDLQFEFEIYKEIYQKRLCIWQSNNGGTL